MKFALENIAGGGQHACRTLTGAARYVARNPVYGGYRIVGDRVQPESDYDAVLAVTRYAEAARMEIGREDWEAVVDLCVTWFGDDHED